VTKDNTETGCEFTSERLAECKDCWTARFCRGEHLFAVVREASGKVYAWWETGEGHWCPLPWRRHVIEDCPKIRQAIFDRDEYIENHRENHGPDAVIRLV
jgi:hypothetical protein